MLQLKVFLGWDSQSLMLSCAPIPSLGICPRLECLLCLPAPCETYAQTSFCHSELFKFIPGFTHFSSLPVYHSSSFSGLGPTVGFIFKVTRMLPFLHCKPVHLSHLWMRCVIGYASILCPDDMQTIFCFCLVCTMCDWLFHVFLFICVLRRYHIAGGLVRRYHIVGCLFRFCHKHTMTSYDLTKEVKDSFIAIRHIRILTSRH